MADGAAPADAAGDGEDPVVAELLTDEIGSGPKSAGDMTYAEARAAVEDVFDHSVDPIRLGAFWLANRWKRNTPEELAAFLDEARDRMPESAGRRPDVEGPVLDCGANYDGKRETPIYGVAAGLVAASAGVHVAVHSGPTLPATRGATYRDVLDALDVPTDLAPAESRTVLEATGFGFYHQRRCNPAVHGLLDERERFGLRTFLNTVETLADPAGADVHLGSFFHASFARKVVAAVDRSESLDFERVAMVQGLEGYDDVRPGTCTVARWDGGEDEDGGDIDDALAERRVATADHGLAADRDALAVEGGGVAAASARITREVLAGDRDDAHRDAVVLNAGIRLWAAERVGGLADGVELARETLAGGEPARRLDRLRDGPVSDG